MPENKIHEGIEIWRVLACLAVIVTHLKPGVGISPLFSKVIVRSTDFAVPFFYCVSGYFFWKSLKKKHKKNSLVMKYFYRLVPPFLFWYLVFFLFPDMAAISSDELINTPHYSQLIASRIQLLIENPWTAITQGPGYHLWYLVGLAIAYFIVGVIFTTFSVKIRQPSVVIIGLICYLIAFLVGSLGWSHLHLRPFVSVLFISTGCIIEQHNLSIRREVAAGFFFAFLVLHISESFFWQKIDAGFDETFNISTIFLGLTSFLFALATPTVKPFLSRIWLLGSLSFGVYLLHPLIIYSYNRFTIRIGGSQKIILGIFAPIIVSGLSFAAAYIINKSHILTFSIGNSKTVSRK